jgi:hypothetical protein
MRIFLYKSFIFVIPVLVLLGIPTTILVYSGESFSKIEEVVEKGDEYLIGFAYQEVNYEFLKWKELYNKPKQEVIALGSSRVLPFRDKMFITSFYNCGYTITSIADFLPFLKAIPTEKKPKYLILGLDQWMFNANWDELNTEGSKNRYSPAILDWKGLYTANFSPAIIKDVWKDLFTRKYGINIFEKENNIKKVGLNAILNNKGFLKDGSFYYGNHIDFVLEDSPLANDYHFQDTYSRIEEGNRRFEYASIVNPKAINKIKELLSYLKEENIKAIAFLPPFADAVNTKMEETKKYAYMEQIYPLLKPIFETYDFELWDMSHFSTYSADDKEAIDGFHGGEVAYLRMMIYMIENNSILKDVTDIFQLKKDLDNRINTLLVYPPYKSYK